MKSEDREQLIQKINNEIDQPEDEMDVAEIENMLDECLDGHKLRKSKRQEKKMACRIINDHSTKKAPEGNNTFQPFLVPAIVILLVGTLLITAFAKRETIVEGIMWLGEKISITTSMHDSNTSDQASSELYIADIFQSGQYYLPHDIYNNFKVQNYYENYRSDECHDICMEFTNNSCFANLILSKYSGSETPNIISPSENTEFEEQLTINGIEVCVFELDGIYSVYYAYENVIYQLTTDMTYEDLVEVLQSIRK